MTALKCIAYAKLKNIWLLTQNLSLAKQRNEHTRDGQYAKCEFWRKRSSAGKFSGENSCEYILPSPIYKLKRFSRRFLELNFLYFLQRNVLDMWTHPQLCLQVGSYFPVIFFRIVGGD